MEPASLEISSKAAPLTSAIMHNRACLVLLPGGAVQLYAACNCDEFRPGLYLPLSPPSISP